MLQAYGFAEKYFGGWQRPSTVAAEGPAAISPAIALGLNPNPKPQDRHFEEASAAGPLLLKAFYRPPSSSDDSVPLEVIA